MSIQLDINDYSSSAHIVSEAIDRSKYHGDIVEIRVYSVAQQDHINGLLEEECDRSFPETGDYWGSDLDSNAWRVRIIGG